MLNLNHLKYFFDAAAEKSVAKAAVKNFVSQSAISQSIRNLEKSLDCKLLIHKKNTFQLTEEGQLVVQKYQDIFNSVTNLKNEVKFSKSEISGRLAVACSHSIAISLLPDFLKAFKKSYPLVKIKLKLGKTSIVKKWVLDRDVDFGIVVDDGNLATLEKRLIRRGSFIFISNNTKIENTPSFIITEPRPETNKLRQHFLKMTKKELPIMMEVDSWEVINQLSRKGLGIGFVPDLFLGSQSPHMYTHGLKLPKIEYDLVVVKNKGLSFSRSARAFVEQLTEEQNSKKRN